MTEHLTAVRFADGRDDIIEGIGIPFGGPIAGRDLTGWYFDPQTDLALDWFGPGQRPVLYDHGLDDGPGMSVVGRVQAWRTLDAGIWVQVQLDRASRYADAVKRLVKAGALGFSSGSVEHLATVRSDGRIERWPWVELSLTPEPANPEAVVGYQLPVADATRHLIDAGVPEAVIAIRFESNESNDGTEPAPAHPEPADPKAGRGAELVAILSEAVALHRAHMDGTEPTSEASQGRLAGLLDAALAYAQAEAAEESDAAMTEPPEPVLAGPTIQSIHDATLALGATCGEATGQAMDSPPAAVLAIRAGNDVEPVSDADLARIANLLGHAATARARELLGMT